MTEFIYLSLAFVINFSMGLFVWTRDPKHPDNISYFAFATALSFWVLSFGITFISKDSLLWTRIIVFWGVFIPPTLILFSKSLHRKDFGISKLEAAFHILLIIFFICSLPFKSYVKSAELTQAGLNFKYGIIYNINGLYLLFGVGYALFNFIQKYRHANDKGKNQIKNIFIGCLTGLLIGLTFSYILPALGFVELNKYTTLASIGVLGFYAYAITKHELMNIQLMITRTGAYLITTAIILGLMLVPYYFLPGHMIFVLFAGAIATISGRSIAEFIREKLNKTFIPDFYDPEKIKDSILKESALISDRTKLFKTLVKEIRKTVKV
ncbi:MAG: hypothetical protein GY730_02555, partial [bacterium]|nr:hypothetical protein [bacterium]